MAETDIHHLLRYMQPELEPEKLVFVVVENVDVSIHLMASHAMVQEQEGVTLVLPQDYADSHRLVYQDVFQKITLQIHSDLNAVGLTAALTTALAQQQIPANVIAGYYHDHILVPESRGRQALQILRELSQCT